MTEARSCPWCGADTVRLTAVPGYVVRTFDVTWHLAGSYRLDPDAGLAYYDPPKHEFDRLGGRHRLHRDTCPDWQGPVGG